MYSVPFPVGSEERRHVLFFVFEIVADKGMQVGQRHLGRKQVVAQEVVIFIAKHSEL